MARTYPGFSERNQNWIYVYEQHLRLGARDTDLQRALLRQTLIQLKESGQEGYEVFGRPEYKAEEDLASAELPEFKVRYGLLRSPSAVLGVGATYLAYFSFFWALSCLFRQNFSFDLTLTDLVLPLGISVAFTALMGAYALLSSGYSWRALGVLLLGFACGGAGLASLDGATLVPGFPVLVWMLILLLPALAWFPYRRRRPAFTPVDSAAAWENRFAGVLRWRYWTNPAPYLAEVRQHCALTENTPQAEFGHPEFYAYDLERALPALKSRRRTGAILLIGVLLIAGFVGFGLLTDESYPGTSAFFYGLINLLLFGQYTNLAGVLPESEEAKDD